MRTISTAMLSLFLLAMCGATFAQKNVADESSATRSVFKTAPVIVDGEILFTVRGVTSFPATERARGIRKRILAAARDKTIDPESIQAVEFDRHFQVQAGPGVMLVEVFAADAELEAIPLDLLADTLSKRIKHSVVQYRQDRSASALKVSAISFAVLTAVFVILIWSLKKFKVWITRVLKVRISSDMKQLEQKSRRLIQRNQVFDVVQFLLHWLYVIILITLGYFYVHSVLGTFPWTRGFARILLNMVMTPVESMLSSFVATIPNLIFLAIIFIVFRFVLRALKLFFNAVGTGRIKLASFEKEWADTTYRIVRILVIAFALVVAYPYIPGSDSAAFKGVSLFLGLIFSLGSTSFISNMMAGLTMTYRGAYREGDWVRIGTEEGQVEAMRMMVMRLRTRKNESVTIPNSVILNANVTNYSAQGKSDGIIIHTEVGIGYDVSWQQVQEFLLEAASRTADLKTSPKPFVLEKALGDYAVTYELNAFCKMPEKLPAVYADLHRNILDVFNEHEVQIMSPAYIADPPEPKIAPVVKPAEGEASVKKSEN